MVGRICFVARAEVEHASHAITLVDAVARSRSEFWINARPHRPNHSARKCFVTDREMRLENVCERRRCIEGCPLHLFGGDDEGVDAFADGMPRRANLNRLHIVGFSPPAFEVSGATEQCFESL